MTPESEPKFPIGSRVVANRETWTPNEFDSYGRGLGVGIVVEPPFPLDSDTVDVRWPCGCCFEFVRDLLPAEPDGRE